MNGADVRAAWQRTRDNATTWAVANRQSHEALLAMIARYRSLAGPERAVVDQLLGEQALSHDDGVRFDALALIREFRITTALPALRTLSDRLETEHSPGAPYEWEKVNLLIAHLTHP